MVQSKMLAAIPGIRHGFGTRIEPLPSSLEPEWTKSHPSWKQVHGVAYQEVQSASQKCGDVDGLITRMAKIPIAVVTADCVPVLFAKLDGSAVAAVHAGWRGTLAGATLKVWEHLQSQGEKSSEWAAAIGPAIGPCCYEVSEELTADFIAKKSGVSASIISPSFRKLDLQGIHEKELCSLGFKEVEVIRMCTHCHGGPENFTFHSYRRDQNKERQYSGLFIK